MGTLRPAILFISSSWPHGQAFGGQLRALYTGRALREIGPVSLTVVSSDSVSSSAILKSAAEFEINAPIHPSLNRNHGLLSKIRWAFDSRYLNLHGALACPNDCDRIASRVPQYDLVWILNSRTPNILQTWFWPHSHLDIDDVPSTYTRTLSRSADKFSQRLKRQLQTLLLKRREMLLKRRFTTLSVCSEADRQYLGGGKRIHVIPNGFERPLSEPVPAPVKESPRIGFIGLCSYHPNAQGVRWFLQSVWPRVRKAVPNVRLRLIGKDSDSIFHGQCINVDALGWIEDPSTEIASWSSMVIPIRLGGGTRVKLADAFSRKCPVVSTSLGAFGYEVQNGRELLLADDPAEFAAACVSLIRDPSSAAQMAARAYRAFLEKWTWDAIAPRVWAAAEDCLRRSSCQRLPQRQTAPESVVSVAK